MKPFDKEIKRRAREEGVPMPEEVEQEIRKTLATLPETDYHPRRRMTFRVSLAAACFVFLTLFVLPNVSIAYGKALEQIPVLGDVVRVVTIRNYFYTDENHELHATVPQIHAQGDGAQQINEDVDMRIRLLVDCFYQELHMADNQGHGSLSVDYETVTDSKNWFTLKIRVNEEAGSGDTSYKYYHLDKRTGKTVKLGDLIADDRFYDIVSKDLKRQMKAAMQQHPELVYWTEDSITGEDTLCVDPNHNFYWNENGDLVLPFDKYEIAPGSMGTPEFVIDKTVIRDALRPEFQALFA